MISELPPATVNVPPTYNVVARFMDPFEIVICAVSPRSILSKRLPPSVSVPPTTQMFAVSLERPSTSVTVKLSSSVHDSCKNTLPLTSTSPPAKSNGPARMPTPFTSMTEFDISNKPPLRSEEHTSELQSLRHL